jgi:hypothetical protein
VAPTLPASPDWDAGRRTALVIGLAGCSGCALASVFQPAQFYRSYLIAYTFWLGVGLGCLVLLMVQHLTGGIWGLLLRRTLESAAHTLVPLTLLFVPLLLGLRQLYPWARLEEMNREPILQHKQLYLNTSFFLIRACVYFLIWLALALLLNWWSTDNHEQSNGPSRNRVQILSGVGLVLYGATITFASIDWVMSIEPDWYSTIYPVMYASGQLLTAFAFAVAVLMVAAAHSSTAEVLAPQQMRNLGNLLLAFVMLWAYLSFSQFLLIWTGNLPEEIPWYLKRGRGGWQWVALLLFLCQFALPFLLLLWRTVKHDRRFLGAVACGILLLRLMDVIWWIEPAYPHDELAGYVFWVMDLAAWVSLGGVWMWWFLGQLQKRPVVLGQAILTSEAAHHG